MRGASAPRAGVAPVHPLVTASRASPRRRARPPALAPQPLAVEEMRPGVLAADACPAETGDRLAVERLGGVALAHERARARLEPERPVRAARARHLREPPERVVGDVGPVA